MEPRQIEGLISLVLGVMVILFATGLLKARTTPEANAAFLRKYRWLLLVVTLFLVVRGSTLLAKLYW